MREGEPPRSGGGTPQGCPVPWHASSAESCPQAGFRQRAFLLVFFLFFLVFSRARARTARKALSGAGLRRFLSYPNSPFFRVSCPFFRVYVPFFGWHPQLTPKKTRDNSPTVPYTANGTLTRRVGHMGQLAEVWMELEPAQALALAQFVKRVGWSEIRENAVDDDEAYVMRDALGFLAKALQEAGYAPR